MLKRTYRVLSLVLMLAIVLTTAAVFLRAEKAGAATAVTDGWYKLKLGGNFLNIDADGKAELRQSGSKQNFYLENKGTNQAGNNQVTLKMEDGRYLGISDEIKDGTRLKAVKEAYVWNISFTTGGLRPPSKPEMVASASAAQYGDGNSVILWTKKDSTPDHARFSYVPKDLATWPFLPSKENMTNGKIKSGWAYIIAGNDGKLLVNDDNTVSPSRRYNRPFYFEHLGKDVYHIYAAYGGCLAVKGKETDGASIVISQVPYKWQIYSTQYDHSGIAKYMLAPDANHKYNITVLGSEYNVEDSRLLLSSNMMDENAVFQIAQSVTDGSIPTWWKDYKDGKEPPTSKVEPEEDTGHNYYAKLAFEEEKALPVTTTSINYNLELPAFHSYQENWSRTSQHALLSRNERGTYREAYADGEYVTITNHSTPEGGGGGQKEIKYEMRKFGAIYSGVKYNYIAFGQDNPDQNNNKEVIRIVKYDKEFNRISSVSVNGGQTRAVKMFYFTARFAESGNKLILHTAREMYKSADGRNHQANLTIYVDTNSMKVTRVTTSSGSYVSHSFDTFVRFNGSTPVFLDLGDANPRSVVLQKDEGSIKKATMFPIVGPKGANFTGVSIGGFEISDSSYLAPLAVIVQSTIKWGQGNANSSLNSGMRPTNDKSLGNRDIVLTVLPRDYSGGATASQIMLAKYNGTAERASTPQILKISGNKFAVVWGHYSNKPIPGYTDPEPDDEDYEDEEYDDFDYWDPIGEPPTLFYVQYIDGKGNKLGDRKQYKKSEEIYTDYIKEVNKTNPSTPSKTWEPAVPASLKAERASKTSAICTWRAVPAASGYEVYFAASEKGSYKKAGTVTKEVKLTKKSLKPGTRYYFKVRAYKTVDGKKMYGSFTKVKSIKL